LTRPTGYRNYTSDGRYWTVRKQGNVFWVVLIDPSSGNYEWSEVWGGYTSPGAAGGAAAQLAYAQGSRDTLDRLRGILHTTLDEMGLGVPAPQPAPVSSASVPADAGEGDGEEEA